jgi:poly(A) polymerase
LIEAGLSPGKKFAELLEEVRNAQLEGRVTTREEAMHYVKQMAAEGN